MKRNRKVKILATLGPASSDEAMIRKLHEAGADLFRINMSHASHDVMRSMIAKIRSVEAECGRPIGILCDLQGPKLRVGKFAETTVELVPGQTFTLDDKDEPGDNTRVFLPHPEILTSVKPGHRLLIDDGKLHLRAEKCDGKSIVTTVVSGTKISDRKGVSLPDTLLATGVLTDKDRADLDAVLATNEVDWVALSFIQRPEDLAEVRKIARGRVGLMSKIEKPQAIERIDEIIELSDALMVARGDLGVEMPLEAVPGLQKPPDPRLRCRGQAGGRRDPDARINDIRASPDPRRSLRRRDRRVRRRRCHHAVGRVGIRPVSGRGGFHHGVHCSHGGTRAALSGHHLRSACSSRGYRRRRHFPCCPTNCRDAEAHVHRLLHILRQYRASRRA